MSNTNTSDASHPALDNDAAKNASEKSNRIDLNDPSISGAEAVKRNLEDGGIPTGPAQTNTAHA